MKAIVKTAALPALALMAGMSGALAQEELTVATYGGEWGAALQACILDPFTKETGIRVTPEPGVSGVTLNKMRQQKGAPTLDAVWLDGGVSEIAAGEKLLAEIDAKAVPAMAGLVPQAIYKDQAGKVFAAGTGFYSLGLAYNTEKVKQAPASWNDLWRDDVAGSVTFPSPANAMGVPFIAHIAALNGGNAANTKPGLEKLKSLKTVAFFDTAGAGTNLFQSGEATMGAHYASSAYAMRDQKLPIAFVVPKEGAIGGDIRLHLVAGSKKQASAEKFVNFALGVAPATCMAERIYVGPATKGVTLSDNAKQRMPWGSDGSVTSLALPDWVAINQNRAAVLDTFNREVATRKN